MLQLQSVLKLENNSLNVQHYYCISKKPAFRVCINQDCTSPSICCKDNDCLCNQIHIYCPQINLESLIKKINSKVVNTTQIHNQVTTRFDKIIDTISQIFDEIYKILKRYGLRKEEITFLRYLEDNCQNKLTGKVVYNANKIAKEKYEGDFKQIQKCVNTLWGEMQGLFWGTLYSMKDLYEIPLNRGELTKNAGENFVSELLKQMKESLKGIQPKRMTMNRQLQEQQKQQQRQGEQSEILKQKKSQKKEKEEKKQFSSHQKLGNHPYVDRYEYPDQGEHDELKQLLINLNKNGNNLLKQETVRDQSKIVNEKVQDSKQLSNNRANNNLSQGLLFNFFLKSSTIINNRDPKFNQACKFLCEVCDIKQEVAEKFVRQNCYNILGKLYDAEEILNIWYNKENP